MQDNVLSSNQESKCQEHHDQENKQTEERNKINEYKWSTKEGVTN